MNKKELIDKLSKFSNGGNALLVFEKLLEKGTSEIKISQEELALELNKTRPAIQKCLNTLNKLKVLEFGYGTIKISPDFIESSIGNFLDYEPEGIKYMGSKSKILKKIFQEVQKLDIPNKPTILDGFAGSTRVGQFFRKNGFIVTSNDLNIWSKTFGECYISSGSEIDKEKLLKKIKELNNLKGIDGWYSKNYGGVVSGKNSAVQSDGKKRIWQKHNTKKLDAIREKISYWKKNGEITSQEESILITSLINALDKVESTLGHYVSYLKEWSPRSYKTMNLVLPKLIDGPKGKSIQSDIFEAIKSYHDVMYFDPPYGSSNDKMPSSRVRYGQYYHIWKTIILNDKPELIGEINKREDASVEGTYSVFEEYKKDEKEVFIAFNAIKRLIQEANCKYIVFSYNNNSRVPVPDILDWVKKQGYDFEVSFFEHAKNVMAHCSSTMEWTELAGKKNDEMLLVIKKGSSSN